MADVAEIFFVAVFIFMFSSYCDGERHTIKIVEEPSSYGIMNSYQGGLAAQTNEDKLKMRITPSNFSGPALFKRLYGKCFTKTDDTYKYELCPFKNVSQHEQSLRWNPYSGILGVWQEWEIENNTFVAMVMREGDKCGDKQRSMKVFFVCGKVNAILNVTEPTTCNYHMNFSTPYVCHQQAMLVYPTLNTHLQKQWGILEGELAAQQITKKGYKKYLHRVFVNAGYMLSADYKNEIASNAVAKEKEVSKQTDGNFDTLYQCTEEYRKLKTEVEDLKNLLAQANNLENNDHLSDMDHDYMPPMDN